ncbi:MAG: metal-dependent transcriptional regulator [Chloroflexi bacterium]|nr:metal-dependent transcriptional regulator [Chloroflexota bacterium]
MQTFCGLTTDGMLDYLATIYKLEQRHDRVTTGALAARMSVSAAAASSMLKRLEDGNFVERSSADGITLTEQGRLAALQLIRRHRLLEVFLIQVMGYSWDQVDQEAHALQHAISSAFEERMDALCGYPTHCPHGDPIPSKEGRMPAEDLVPLVELQPASTAYIRRVATDDSRILRYLARLELTPGKPVVLHDIAPFNGPVTVERLDSILQNGDESKQVLGHELAGLLFVELVSIPQPVAVPA